MNSTRPYINILLEKWQFTQLIVQPDLAHHIGLVPVFWNSPALGHHTLGGGINHVFRPKFLGEHNQFINLTIKINLSKAELIGSWESSIREKNYVRFRGTTNAKNLMRVLQYAFNKLRPRKSITSDHHEASHCTTVLIELA